MGGQAKGQKPTVTLLLLPVPHASDIVHALYTCIAVYRCIVWAALIQLYFYHCAFSLTDFLYPLRVNYELCIFLYTS